MMDTIKVEKKNVKMVAHRGLSGIEKENTNAAFVAAGNRSYFGVETDIRIAKDGNVVIMHDDGSGRVAKDNLIVSECTYDALGSIILDDIDGAQGRNDLRIPLFSDYLSICKKYGKKCVVELKPIFTEDELKKIINIVNEFDYLDNVIFIAFGIENLITLRGLLPNQPAQWLVCEWKEEYLSKLKEYNLDLDIHYNAVTKELVDMLHSNGIEINCWTCDIAEDADKLIECGVDYITSNILE